MANEHEYKSSIQFLCTDASKYMTGQSIIIDGEEVSGDDKYYLTVSIVLYKKKN